MTQRLFGISGNDRSLVSGIYPNPTATNTALWEDALNVNFDGIEPKRAEGYGPAFLPPFVLEPPTPTPIPIRGLGQTEVDGQRRVYFGTRDQLWLWLGGDQYQLLGSGYNGIDTQDGTTPATQWSLLPYGRFLIASNGRDPVQYWPNTIGTPAVDLDTENQFRSAEILMAHKAYVLAANTDTDPYAIFFSGFDNPQVWEPLNANQAGRITVRDVESGVIALSTLGAGISVYFADQMQVMSFVGTPFIFGIQNAINGIGPVSKHAVVSTGRKNYGWGLNGIWETDGSYYEYISDVPLQRFLEREVNHDQNSKIVGWHYEKREEIIWWYPAAGSQENNRGIGYNYRNRAFTKYDHGHSASLERQVFDFPILGGTDGVLRFYGSTRQANNDPLQSYVETKAMDLGAPEVRKYVDILKTRLNGSLDVQIAYLEFPDQAPQYGPVVSVSGDMRQAYFTGQRDSGPYVKVRFSSSDVGNEWQLGGFDLHGDTVGETQ